MGRTHAVGGVASLWLLALVPGAIAPGMAAGPGNVGLLAAVAAFGALLPDLDAGISLLSAFRIGTPGFAPFAIPARILNVAFGHRGALHSLAALAVVAAAGVTAAFVGFAGWQAASALALGYASHLLLDACTPRGIPLLWPRRARFHALQAGARIATDSPGEGFAFAFLAAAAMALLLPHAI